MARQSSEDVAVLEDGDIGGLYAQNRGPEAFEVRSRGAAAGSFGYRVVAKGRQSPGRGQERGAAPQITLPKDVPVPTTPPELPPVEESRPGREGRPDGR